MKTYHITGKGFVLTVIFITFIMISLFIQNIILSARVKLLEDTVRIIIEEYEFQKSTIKQYIRTENPAITESRAVEITKAITSSARSNGLDPFLLTSLARIESSFDTAAVSRANARGLCQVRPATFYEVHNGDIDNLQDNIEAGARYLRKLIQRFGDLRLALAAYNCGPSRSAGRILQISGGYADQVLAGWRQLQNQRKELVKCYCTSPMYESKAGKLYAFSPRTLTFICGLNAIQMFVKPDFYRF